MSEAILSEVVTAIHALVTAVHKESYDLKGNQLGPTDLHGTPVASLSDALLAVAWEANGIAESIDRLTANVERLVEEKR